jgi:two-component system phosphate regulon sensor histidine kinase PhoR
LRSQRSAIWIAAGIAVAALATAGFADLQASDAGAGWSNRIAVLRLIICCVGAVGVIFLGIGYHRLTGAVTSMAARLKSEQPVNQVAAGAGVLQALIDAVGAHVEACDGTVRRLQGELKGLQIRLQLAEREKRHAEAILYSLRDAVIVVDGSGRLLMANEPAERLFGFDAEDGRHKPLTDTVGRTHAEFAELLQQSGRNRTEATRRELQFTQGDRLCTFDTIISCVEEGAKVSGIVAVLHDVTKEKEVSQMKNDFVSHVSHELKTPLASITAYSEMLVDGEADDEETRKEFYSIIQSQAQRLNRLIEDILNTSRIESGLIKVNKERASLTILIQDQMRMIRSYAEEKHITVTSPDPIVYDQVYVDRDMVSQVIINLLSNAVKYTPAGGSVTVGTEVDEPAGVVRVTVTDTGVGIPDEEIGRVFEKFYRVTANNKQAKGTGLGLNLVKQIVEKVHGGRVFVTSKVGTGSTFGFELPLATAEQVATV